jgi:FixJ family two-component response regulator
MNTKQNRVICVIDDDSDVRDSIRVLMEAYGFTVLDFPSADDFLKTPIRNDIGCLLIDFQMPGKTGLELLEELRARKIQIPAIVVTANGRNLTPRLTRAGVLTLLRKPVDGDEILDWVEKAFAQKPHP